MIDSAHSSLSMTDIGLVVGKLHRLTSELPVGERAVLDDLLRAASVVETTPPQYNPFLPGVHANPYPRYHLIQADNPVHWSDAMQAWVISRHADVERAFRDQRLSYRTGFETMMACVPIDEHDSVRAISRFLASLLNEIDPPDHTRLRRIMTRALAATRTRERLGQIESVANNLLDAVEASGHMDLVEDFAYPLPAIVGADLLGIPATARQRFGELIHDVVHTFSQGFSGTAAMRRGESAVSDLTEYLKKLLRERRQEPRQDVLTALSQADDATEDERVLVAANIIMGMHENVSNAISLGMSTILQDAKLHDWLRTHLEHLPSAVEEVLRYEGTAPILSRVALEEIDLGTVTIPKGDRVILLLAAANRDEEHFVSPDRFIPTRQPNAHIAFGVGKRACPGSALGRSLVLVALSALLIRFPTMRLADAESAWREEINIRGLGALPVSWM
jgi:cytochrome P450